MLRRQPQGGYAGPREVVGVGDQIGAHMREGLDAVHDQEALISSSVLTGSPSMSAAQDEPAIILGEFVQPRVIASRRNGERRPAECKHFDPDLWRGGRNRSDGAERQFGRQTDASRALRRKPKRRPPVIDIHERPNGVRPSREVPRNAGDVVGLHCKPIRRSADSSVRRRSRSSVISASELTSTCLPGQGQPLDHGRKMSSKNGIRLEQTTSPTTTVSTAASSAIRK